MGTDTESLHQNGDGGKCLQGELFRRSARIRNAAPIAAKADPVSSLLAAQDITTSGKRSERKCALINFLRTRSESLTSYEIALALGWDRHETAKRLPDARADALVENGPMRRCRVTNRWSLTWRVARA
jgi:hypothetical protein